MAAGWTGGYAAGVQKVFEFIRPAMGSQPSTPAGRQIETLAAALEEAHPERNCTPSQPFSTTKASWTRCLTR